MQTLPRARACRAGLVVACLLALSEAAASGFVRHPFQAAQPANAPAEVLLAVEIPAGSAIKFEIGADGLVFVDRFLSMPMAYPGNYGSIPRSRGGDGDPLDALVLTRQPLPPGVLIRFRPLGVLRMTDRGEHDEKIIGVPADDVDATFSGIRDIADLAQAERDRIEAFFRVYKDLPIGGNQVVLAGWGDAAEARALVDAGIRRYAAGQPAR